MESYNSWWEEMRSAYLYNVMAESERNVLHKKLFSELKKAAEKQANIWAKKIAEQTRSVPRESGGSNQTNKTDLIFKPDIRTKIIAKLIVWLGTENLHTLLSSMKIRGMSVFRDYHSEHKHTTLSAASNLRAAVFGINDGLISNMSLILGIAGANASQHFIVLTGIAGLLAGAFSMGAGEYISVRSQREIFEYQIEIERKELEEYPEEEMEELSLIYQARGVPKNHAVNLAKILVDNPETALNTLAREELGLDPEELVSPIGAMISSFISFAIGAFIPVLPFLFGNNPANLAISMGATAISLFVIGAIIGFMTNRKIFLQGLRMLCVGAIAGTITYIIGKWLGVENA